MTLNVRTAAVARRRPVPALRRRPGPWTRSTSPWSGASPACSARTARARRRCCRSWPPSASPTRARCRCSAWTRAMPAERVEIRRRLGYLPQELGYHRHFTVAAFLDYVAILKEITGRRRRAEEVARVLAATGLERCARTPDPDPVRRDAPAAGHRPGPAGPARPAGPRRADGRAGPGAAAAVPGAAVEPARRPGDRAVHPPGRRHRRDLPARGRAAPGPGPASRAPRPSWPPPRPGRCGRRTGATAGPTCPGGAATGGGGTSATIPPTGVELGAPTVEDGYLLLSHAAGAR